MTEESVTNACSSSGALSTDSDTSQEMEANDNVAAADGLDRGVVLASNGETQNWTNRITKRAILASTVLFCAIVCALVAYSPATVGWIVVFVPNRAPSDIVVGRATFPATQVSFGLHQYQECRYWSSAGNKASGVPSCSTRPYDGAKCSLAESETEIMECTQLLAGAGLAQAFVLLGIIVSAAAIGAMVWGSYKRSNNPDTTTEVFPRGFLLFGRVTSCMPSVMFLAAIMFYYAIFPYDMELIRYSSDMRIMSGATGMAMIIIAQLVSCCGACAGMRLFNTFKQEIQNWTELE